MPPDRKYQLGGFTVTASGASHNVTFYKSMSDFVTTGGVAVMLRSLGGKWKKGQIVQERCYYNTGNTLQDARYVRTYPTKIGPTGGDDSKVDTERYRRE